MNLIEPRKPRCPELRFLVREAKRVDSINMYLFMKYLLNTCCMPDSILGGRNTEINTKVFVYQALLFHYRIKLKINRNNMNTILLRR
jgi:hypothetical protein